MPDPTVIVQVINLDRSPDRMAQMAAALDQQGVSFTRLAAVDGKPGPPEAIANYDAQRSRRLFGRPLLAGEVGCYQSHLNAAQAFLDSPDDLGLVLEDDVIVPPEFGEMIAHLRRLASGLGQPQWHVMHLGKAVTKFHLPATAPDWPAALPSPLRAFYLPVTTHALLWSRPGAERFLRDCGKVVTPVDNALKSHSCRTAAGIGFAAPLIQPASMRSLINDGDPRARKANHAKLSRFQVISVRRRMTDYWIAGRAQWAARR